MCKKYDYRIVGSGLFGSDLHTKLHCAAKILVLERRDHVATAIFIERSKESPLHRYGAHIFIRQIAAYGNM